MRDVFFGTEDVKLHGVLLSSEKSGAAAVIILHPHPQFGGSMNNNVVLGLESVLSDAGITTLRFNFRGVGRSGGAFGDGIGEQEDVTRAIDFLASDASVNSIHIAGYSFGALVGLSAGINDDRVKSLSGIAPPTVMASFDFLSDNQKPLFIAAGSQDDFCNVRELAPAVKACGGRMEVIPGADHFFFNHEHLIGEMVREFISSVG